MSPTQTKVATVVDHFGAINDDDAAVAAAGVFGPLPKVGKEKNAHSIACVLIDIGDSIDIECFLLRQFCGVSGCANGKVC